jgi:uncharacterized protein YgbK (DUF1537 family)
VLLKTVDSTLRGHVAAEIRAVLAGSWRATAVIAPAFPAEGRTTEHGVQLVGGVPVHTTEFAHDPAHPVRCSDLAALLPDALLIEPADVSRLPDLIGRVPLLVCSARTDRDLDRVTEAVPRPGDVVWVGSPGLAAALAWRFPVAPAPGVTGAVAAARRPLVVVGSANPATRRQLTRLGSQAGVDTITAPDDTAADDGTGGAISRLRLAPGPVLALHTPDIRYAPSQVSGLMRRLAEIVRPLVRDGTVDALVLTGGETARAVLSAVGATGIDLLDEPEPGVARGTLRGVAECPVVIKAGGFGDDDALVRLCRLLTADSHEPGGHR